MVKDKEEYKKCREATKYPKLFNCYWGGLEVGFDDEFIYENRNKFVEEFNITSCIGSSVPDKYKHIFYYNLQDCKYDHPELFRTRDKKIILINSPYINNDEWFLERGYSIYNTLYRTGVTTYIKVVSKDDQGEFNYKVKQLRMKLRYEKKKCFNKRDWDEYDKYDIKIKGTYPLNERNQEYVLIK